MKTLLQDLRYGMRMLLKQPGFTLVVVLTLSLGIGANTAIFSVVNAVLIRALPYGQPEQLMMVWEKHQRNEQNQINIGNFLDWKAQNHVFSDMAAFADTRAVLTGDGEPEEIPAQRTTDNLFSVLGVNPILGRAFTPEDSKSGQNNVIVISYGLWQRRFGGDPKVIGRKALMGNAENTIIGVMPPNFKWHIRKKSLTGNAAEIWTPLIFTDFMLQRRGRFASAVARLKPGVTIQEARTDMETIGARLAEQYKGFNSGYSVNVTPLRQQFSGELRQGLFVLMSAVGCMLLIACANVANLLLGRAAARRKEIAVRAAIGAGRWRILRQLLTESVLLASLGGAAGLLLAGWGADLLLRLSPPELSDLQSVEISAPVLGFTFAVTMLMGLLFGLLPAFEATRLDLHEVLKDGGRSSGSALSGQRMRSGFVIAEIAMALVMLISAGILLRSYLRLQAVDPGFDARNVLTMRVALPGRIYDQDQKVIGFFNRAIEAMQALPGVESAGAVNFLPFAGPGSVTGFNIEGRPLMENAMHGTTGVSVTDQNYFHTLRIPLKRGRLFNEQETREMRHVVVINESLVQKYFPHEDPIGRRLTIGLRNGEVLSEIIGVVGDVKQTSFDVEAIPMAFWPLPKSTYNTMSFVIRTKGDPTAIASAARNVIRSIDPRQPVADVRPLESLLGGSIARQRFQTLLLSIFALTSLLLAAIGVYGVMAYSVSRRTPELGVRIALGAQKPDILKLVIGQGMKLTLAGIAMGLISAFFLTSLMSRMLFGVTATDPITFLVIPILQISVAFLACWIPAMRATKVDPMVALRAD